MSKVRSRRQLRRSRRNIRKLTTVAASVLLASGPTLASVVPATSAAELPVEQPTSSQEPSVEPSIADEVAWDDADADEETSSAEASDSSEIRSEFRTTEEAPAVSTELLSTGAATESTATAAVTAAFQILTIGDTKVVISVGAGQSRPGDGVHRDRHGEGGCGFRGIPQHPDSGGSGHSHLHRFVRGHVLRRDGDRGGRK